MAFEIQNILLITVICHTVLGEDDSEEGVSPGVIVTISIVGFIIAVIAIFLCFHQSCTKAKQRVKPQRINVVGLRHRTVPPSRVIPTAPPATSTGLAPVDPPPYNLYDHANSRSMEPRNTYEPRNPFRQEASSHFDRHPPPIVQPTFSQGARQQDPVVPYTRHLHQQQPPPYSG